jgi:hypothetical protein
MSRILVIGANVAVAALMLVLAGCGGGIDEGMPKDTTPAVDVNALKLAPTKGAEIPGAVPKDSAAHSATPRKN